MKKKPFKIVISPSGDITSVYSDRLMLNKLGTAYIRRATDVSFNNKDGSWSVIGVPPIFSGRILLAEGFHFRADAILWEVEYLNRHMRGIIESYSTGGYFPREIEVFRSQEAQV